MNKSRLLFVRGTHEIMHDVVNNYGFGYWSGSFDILLEKHGILEFDSADHTILDSKSNLRNYGAIVIAWLPEHFWKVSYVNTLREFTGPIFIEGPYPDFVKEFIGIKDLNLPKVKEGRLYFYQSDLRNFVEQSFKLTLDNRIGSIEICPKKVQTIAKELARQELQTGAGLDYDSRLQNVTLSYFLAYKNRYKRWDSFFPYTESDSKKNKIIQEIFKKSNIQITILNELSTLAWCKFVSRIQPGNFREKYITFLQKIIEQLPPPVLDNFNEKIFIASSIRGLILIEASQLIQDKSLASKAEQIAEHINDSHKKVKGSPLFFLWYLFLLVCLKNRELEESFISDAKIAKVLNNLPEPGAKISAEILWLISNISKKFNGRHPELSKKFHEILAGHFNIVKDSFNDKIPSILNERQLWEAILISGALRLFNLPDASNQIISLTLNQAYDHEKSLFIKSKIKKGKYSLQNGYQIMPWVLLGLVDNVDSFEIFHSSDTLNNYETSQISAWEKPPYWIEPYSVDGGCDLAFFVSHFGLNSGLFKKGNIMGSCFQIFSYLVHYHTMHPLEEAFYDCPARHIMVLEHVVFYLLKLLITEAECPIMTVNPWPWGKKYCLTIRHDVDRQMTPEIFNRLLNFEKDNAHGVSWYWIPGRLDLNQIKHIEEAGQEIGLHSMRILNKHQERHDVESALVSQGQIYGEQWHGGGGGDYWIGHPSIRAAVEVGFMYTEFVATINDFPYACFPAMKADGSLYNEPIIGTTRFMSVDSGARIPIEHKMIKLQWVGELAANQFYCILLNHPDDNFEELKEWINFLPQEGRLNWNCSQVARWWKATHTKEGLNINSIGYEDGQYVYELTAKERIKDLELHFIYPPEKIRKVTVKTNGKSYHPEWQKDYKNITAFARVRLDLAANIPSELRILTS